MGKLRDLASRAGRWLGLKNTAAQPVVPELATGAVVDSRFDTIAWRDVLGQSKALRRLAADLHQTYDYSDDLLRDVFLCAYKESLAVRDREQMVPSRWPNRQIIAGMVSSPELADLRRATTGDAYASAMAVLSQTTALREALQRSKDAQEAADRAEQAREEARQAAEAVAAAIAAAEEAAQSAAVQPDADAEDVAEGEDDQQNQEPGAESEPAQSEDGGEDEGGEQDEPAQTGDGGEDEGQEEACEPDDTGDLEVPADAEHGVDEAIEAAEQAEADAEQAEQDAAGACDAIGAAVRTAARRGLDEAAEQAEADAALMATWGVEPGELEVMSFEERAKLAERLNSGRLRQFAEMVGRFRHLAASERARRMEHVHGEVVGITLGRDLSALVPSELANLALPAMRASFAARYAEGRLMQYDQRGEAEAGLGAIIAAVDCSHSMSWPWAGGLTGEIWAKALALALLDQARTSRRDFVGILFAEEGKFETYRFPADSPARIGDVLKFVERFLDGGTDFQTPLNEAISILAEHNNPEDPRRGDIVLITDGTCDVTEEWMRGYIEARQELGFRTFGVSVADEQAHQELGFFTDGEPGRVLEALSDTVRSITDLADLDLIRDLFRVI